MIRNYLKIILRTLKKNLSLTLIHLVGLSLGLTACLLIGIFIRHEASFDRYHKKSAHIYRFNTVEESKNGVRESGGTPYPFAEAIRTELPDMGLVTQIHHTDETSIRLSNGDQFLIDHILFADDHFFTVFDFEVLSGNPKQILASPNQAIIDQSTANKYFGTKDPIGQMLALDNQIEVEIRGVIKDVPDQTHLPASLIISLTSLTDEFVGIPVRQWGTTVGGATYVALTPSSQVGDFVAPLKLFSDKYLNSDGGAFSHSIVLQPLSQIHFQPEVRSNSPVSPIHPRYLWIFGSIGILILLSAAFNFINLATAQAIKRGREVGVRKVLGASKNQLISQFLGEAIILSSSAGFIAMVLAQSSLPHIHKLLGRNIGNLNLADPLSWLISVGMPLMVGLLAGFYPAFFLARFKPVEALASKLKIGRHNHIAMRRLLVLLQFAITLLLLIGTAIVSKQVSFMREKDLGFAQEGILMIDVPDPGKISKLRNEFLQNPNIANVSFSLGAPTSNNNISTSFHLKGSGEENDQRVALKLIDHEYAPLFDLDLLAGRWINEAECQRSMEHIPQDDRAYFFMVNETLTKKLGLHHPEEAIGQVLVTGINNIEAPIIGVTEDFHGRSLHSEIEPILFLHFPRLHYRAGLELNLANLNPALDHVRAVWSEHFPQHLFNHEFLDEAIVQLYSDEAHLFRLFQLFSLLAIVIGGLGLLGLVSFTTELKTKEIGIRKVLGATVENLMLLLAREYILLVLIAALVAVPISYYLMNGWLANFAYHISVGIGVFLFAVLVSLFVILTTVGLRAFQAATVNPIKSLRDE